MRAAQAAASTRRRACSTSARDPARSRWRIARERPLARIVATDASQRGARRRARRMRAASAFVNVEFVASDWFAALPRTARASTSSSAIRRMSRAGDPHLGEGDVRFEPASALTSGADGLDALRVIVAGAPAAPAARRLAGRRARLRPGRRGSRAVRATPDFPTSRAARPRGIPRVAAGRWLDGRSPADRRRVPIRQASVSAAMHSGVRPQHDSSNEFVELRNVPAGGRDLAPPRSGRLGVAGRRCRCRRDARRPERRRLAAQCRLAVSADRSACSARLRSATSARSRPCARAVLASLVCAESRDRAPCHEPIAGPVRSHGGPPRAHSPADPAVAFGIATAAIAQAKAPHREGGRPAALLLQDRRQRRGHHPRRREVPRASPPKCGATPNRCSHGYDDRRQGDAAAARRRARAARLPRRQLRRSAAARRAHQGAAGQAGRQADVGPAAARDDRGAAQGGRPHVATRTAARPGG